MYPLGFCRFPLGEPRQSVVAFAPRANLGFSPYPTDTKTTALLGNEGVNLTTSDVHDPSTYAERFFVGDVNGDGKQDFIVKYRNETTGCVNFKTYLGTATGNMMPAVTSVLTGVQFFDCDT